MTQRTFIQKAADRVLSGAVLDAEDALRLAAVDGPDLYLLFAEASRVREHFKGKSASICSIFFRMFSTSSFGRDIVTPSARPRGIIVTLCNGCVCLSKTLTSA